MESDETLVESDEPFVEIVEPLVKVDESLIESVETLVELVEPLVVTRDLAFCLQELVALDGVEIIGEIRVRRTFAEQDFDKTAQRHWLSGRMES